MPHIHKLYDFTVSMFIVYQDKCLLHYHRKQGYWMQTGGHVELDEHPEQTLWREIKEETGLGKQDLKLVNTQGKAVEASSDSIEVPVPFSINVHKIRDLPGHSHIDLSYLLVANTDKVEPTDGESEQIGWFGAEEFKKLGVPEGVANRYIFALDFLKNYKY